MWRNDASMPRLGAAQKLSPLLVWLVAGSDPVLCVSLSLLSWFHLIIGIDARNRWCLAVEQVSRGVFRRPATAPGTQRVRRRGAGER